MLQLLNKHELTKRQEGSTKSDQVLSELEKSVSGKKATTYTEKSEGQTCTCAFTSGWQKSCCSEADGKGMNTGDFCGNYRQKLSCNTTEAPVCCNSRAGDAVCCKAGASCSTGCLNGGATNPATGVPMGVCGCIDPPPESEASRLYDEDMAQAMAEVASAASCSDRSRPQDLSKIYKRYTCQECHVAGFELEEGTMNTITEHDIKDDDALFAFVARATSIRADSIVQTGDCILSVRGTKNGANWKRNFQMNFRDHEEPDQEAFNEAGGCEGCGIHKGYSHIYHALKPAAVVALNTLGCGAGSNQPIYATGHSMGAAVASLFIYDLQNNGFNMALSYTFESPRMGNTVFARNFRDTWQPARKVPMFRITNMRDLVVHFPLKNENGFNGGYTHIGAEVYYGPVWEGEPDAAYRYQICSEDDEEDTRCANRYNLLDALKNPGKDHTDIPLLSGGAFDRDQDWCKDVKNECISGGRWRCTE